ncbi:Histone deacetylase 3 [Boothiomyces macroporosus]|uniref:Histone deacetylase n=1 Tax=Boothiomyces macroporosus TaxID=261099 RepID=A0AAD5Y2D3_9FUNG|nr:Histone deacetylase 3 [Boothiomyces macroporosus]
MSHSKERIAYLHCNEVGTFHYGDGHPMKPARLALTHNLVVGYGLHKKMSMYSPRKATDEEIAEFHSEDYVEFIKRVSPSNYPNYQKFQSRFNIGVDDCPVFDGLYDFCAISAGSSIEGARKINSGVADIAINWSGGLHHAKKVEASGFCYINDIVLGIMELLRFHPRVLYIDIDVHHGDGVQEAFYMSNRVMTASFHRYDGQFFPGTGAVDEIGSQDGKYYSINVPLHEHIDDASYAYIFQKTMQGIMESFKPSVVVLQCGADSLAGDRLGSFNLSIKGHGECVNYMKSFKVPLLVLGGGGYTIRNVARCWTYETSVLTESELSNELPYNEYLSHYGPDYKLHPPIVDPTLDNANSKSYLNNILQKVYDYLKYLDGAPSVQMQQIPPSFSAVNTENDVYDGEDRYPERKKLLSRRIDEGEFYEDEQDQDQEMDNE